MDTKTRERLKNLILEKTDDDADAIESLVIATLKARYPEPTNTQKLAMVLALGALADVMLETILKQLKATHPTFEGAMEEIVL